MTGFEISDFLYISGVVCDHNLVMDAEYRLPNLGWITGPFSNSLAKFQREFKVSDYAPQANDCDDFAMDAYFLARKLHRNTKEIKSGLAFGIIAYQVDKESINKELGHALNFFVSAPEGKPTLYFYEPQQCEIATLSEDEKRNTYFYLV